MATGNSRPLGYVLHTTRRIAVIATMHSENVKTGDMVQIWIIRRDMHPIEASVSGGDRLICGDCPHRGDRKTGRKRSCYVNLAHGPRGVYEGMRRGIYPRLKLEDYARVFAGRSIRLGAYGDPAHIPARVLSELCRVSVRHTGYTHQWRTDSWLKPFLMASCDTAADYREATAAGWRTFRVSLGLTPLAGEILCPASEQAGYKTQCQRCGLCNGSGSAKNIFIPVHGSGKTNAFVILN